MPKPRASRPLGPSNKPKNSAKRFADNQPFGLVFGGLAAGVMLAAIFPPSEFERTTLAPFGRRAASIADDAKEQVKEMAQAVGDGFKDAAREGIADAAQQFKGKLGGNNG